MELDQGYQKSNAMLFFKDLPSTKCIPRFWGRLQSFAKPTR